MLPPLSRSAYLYDLPNELIAERQSQSGSRLLVVDKKSRQLFDHHISDLPQLLTQDDLLVFNDPKATPTRLIGYLQDGGKCECLLLREKKPSYFEALFKPETKVRKGALLRFSPDLKATVQEEYEEGVRDMEFFSAMPVQKALEDLGMHEVPTSFPYFNQGLTDILKASKLEKAFITHHLGLGTISPISMLEDRERSMHKDWYEISNETAKALQSRKRAVSIGTSACIALESAAKDPEFPKASKGDMDLVISPDYCFKRVGALLTNFHLPGSSSLMLVSAFGGYELIREAYTKAVERRYRFFSYGDAMLIL